MICIALPPPPSANDLWMPTRAGRMTLTPAYRDWQAMAKREVAIQRAGLSIKGPFRVAIVLPEDMRGDGDNRIKPTLDACQHGGAIANDRDCVGGSWDFEPRSTVLVELTPIPPVARADRNKGNARMEPTP